MLDNNLGATNLDIPKQFILFVSGVPGVGKTTVSYELLKRFRDFRIIEETDILRDALRGYNELLIQKFGQLLKSMLNEIEITDHTKLLTLSDAQQQCMIMKKSVENIVARQQRKGIPSIINGVHIVPETLKNLAENPFIAFINLYVSDEDVLRSRIENRNPTSYMLQHIPFIFQTNLDLYFSTEKLVHLPNNAFHNVEVSALSIDETLFNVIKCIHKKIQAG